MLEDTPSLKEDMSCVFNYVHHRVPHAHKHTDMFGSVYGATHSYLVRKYVMVKPLLTAGEKMQKIINSFVQGPSRDATSYSASQRNFQHFMELELSLPCSQQRTTGLYPEPDESSPHPQISL
jgi:hypothetical protein